MAHFHSPLKLPVAGGSDGAGEVIEVGSRAKKSKKGDRVATLFNPGHRFDPMATDAFIKGGLCAMMDGIFQQYGSFEETGLVRIAANLSYLEGTSLSDAAVTAYNALYGLKSLKPGDWVLVQGTGSVSLFALFNAQLIGKTGGAKVIATTSSPAKADVLKWLGADHVINYREDTNWGITARKFTPNGEGINQILEMIGTDTMTQGLQAIKFECIITIIGLIEGRDTPDTNAEAVRKICTLRGIFVRSKLQMEEMIAEFEVNKIKPILDDRVFALEEVREASKYLVAQKHVVKVMIKIT